MHTLTKEQIREIAPATTRISLRGMNKDFAT